jgi:hypothetical protein
MAAELCVVETGETELPPGFGEGIFSPLFLRPVGNGLGFLLLFPGLHIIVVGVVRCPPRRVIEQVDIP